MVKMIFGCDSMWALSPDSMCVSKVQSSHKVTSHNCVNFISKLLEEKEIKTIKKKIVCCILAERM